MKAFKFIPVLIFALGLVGNAQVAALDFALDGFFNEGASDGFVNEPVINSGLGAPIALGFLPDNRMLVVEKGGEILIADPESLNVYSPYLDISGMVNSGQERGLLDIAIPPDFDANTPGKNLIYLFYTRAAGTDRAVIASYEHIEGAGGLASTADPGTEEILWTDTDGFVNCCHYGGGLDFGPDGKIWLTSSDKFNTTNIGERPSTGEDAAANLQRTSGKIIRINRDGSIPDGTDPDGKGGFWPANPYHTGVNPGPYPIGQNSAHPSIWAYGLRNPFRAAWDAQYGYFYIGEVGGNQSNSWDDIHLASLDQPGAFYGWNFYEGENSDPVYTLPGNPNPAIFDPDDFPFPDFNLADPSDTSVDPNGDYFSAPIFAIPHSSLTGGIVYRGTMFPDVFNGVYFYGNYLDNYIKFLELDTSGTAVLNVWDFKPSDKIPGAVTSIVYLEQGVGGALYYVNYSATGGQVQRIVYQGNASPAIDSVTVTDNKGDANDRSGSAPLTVTFSATVSDTDNSPGQLSYELSFGDGAPATGVPTAIGANTGTINTAHTYNAEGYYSASLRVTDGITSALSPPFLITVGDPNDSPQIVAVGADAVFGDPGLLVTFTATVSDPDADDPPTSLDCSWNFGDGTPAAVCTPNAAGAITVQHTYNNVGNFNASLEISDGEAPTVRSNDISIQIGAASQLPVLDGLVFQVESFIKVGTSGTRVTSWLDESGFGNNLTAAGAPQYVANATPSGLPAIVLDDGGDYLARVDSAPTPLAGLPAGSAPRTMFFVVDYENVTNGEYAGLAYGKPANNQAFGLTLNGNANDLTIQGWGSSHDKATIVDGVLVPGTSQQRGFISHAVVFDGGSFTHYLNGTAIASGAKTYNTLAEKLLIGQNLDGGETRMSVAAAFIYNRALTPSEFGSVEAYIQNTYLSTGVNAAPQAADDLYFVTQGQALAVPASTGLLDNDTDDGPLMLIEINGQPVADGALVALANGSLTIDNDGAFSYTANPAFSGLETFAYTVSDGALSATAMARIHVIVPGSDIVPVIGGLVAHLESDSNVIQDAGVVTAWLSGAGTNMDLVASGDPVLLLGATPSGQAAISLDGGLAAFGEIGPTEGDKLERAAPQVLDLPAGDAPRSMYFVVDYKAANGTFAGAAFGKAAANAAFGLTVNGNGEDLTVQSWSNDFTVAGQNGVGNNDGSVGDDWFVHSIRFDGTTIRHYRDGQLIDSQNHAFATIVEKFVIGANIGDLGFSALDVAAVLLYDKALSDTEHNQTVSYLIQKYLVANANPVAVNDTYTVARDTTLTVPAPGILANDTDADGDTLSAALVGTVSSGTLALNANGSFVYTPAAGFVGTATFDYQARDPRATRSNVARVSIAVTAPGVPNVLVALPFNDGSGTTAVDVSGNGHNGTLLDGAAFSTDTPKGSGFSLSLDGSNDYVNLGSLDMNGNGITLAAWFKADAFPGSSRDPRLISKASGTSGNDHVFMLGTIASGSDTRLRTRVRVGGSVKTLIASAGNLTTGTWAHAAMTYNGTLLRLYLNGVEVGSTNLSGAVDQAPSMPVAVGAQPPGAGARFFDGLLDDVLIAQRALSVAEIGALVAGNVRAQAVADSYSTPQNQALTVAAPGVLSNDTDAEGDALSAVLVNNVLHGTLTLNANGSFVYTPAQNFTGTDSFTYTANDAGGASSPATVTLTVSTINRAPVAVNNSYTVARDTTLTIPAPGILANDTDADGDTLSAALVGTVSSGTLGLNANGSFVYTPVAGFVGTATFDYQAHDTHAALSNVARVSIVVTAPDVSNVLVRLPFNEGSGTTAGDISGNGHNGTLLDGAAFSTDTPKGSGFSLSLDGSNDYVNLGSLDMNGNGITLAAWFKADTFPGSSRDPRLISKASSTSGNDHVFMLGTIASGSDTRLRARVRVGGSVKTLIASAGNLTTGTWAHAAMTYNGTLLRLYLNGVEVGSTNLSGAVDQAPSMPVAVGAQPPGAGARFFDGLLDDVLIAQRALSVFEIGALVAGNVRAQAVADSYSTPQNQALTVTAPGVLSNDTDAEGDALSAVLVNNVLHGTLTLNANGSFVYTPAQNFTGTDSFTYTANDAGGASSPATVTLTVSTINRAPVAVNNSYTVARDTTLTITAPGILANDTDADGDALSAVLVNNVLHGTLTLNANGSFVYTPVAGFVGTATFDYQVRDTHAALSNVARVSIVVTAPGVSNVLVRLPFNEGSGTTADDISGNGHNATLFNGAAFSTDTPKGSAFSLSLDGTNDYVGLGTLATNGSGLTLASWFKADSFAGSYRDPRLISKASGAAENDHVFMLSTIAAGSQTRLRARVRVGNTTKTLIASSGDVLAGAWMHAAMTHDGTTLRLFLNGVQVGSTPLAGTVDQAPTVSVAIGSQPPGAGLKHFDGLMDNVVIAQRAMSAAEITALAAGN